MFFGWPRRQRPTAVCCRLYGVAAMPILAVPKGTCGLDGGADVSLWVVVEASLPGTGLTESRALVDIRGSSFYGSVTEAGV